MHKDSLLGGKESSKDFDTPKSDSRLSSPYGTSKQTYDMLSSLEMRELERDQYYIEKLRAQRSKMEALKQQFHRKEQIIEQQEARIAELETQLASPKKNIQSKGRMQELQNVKKEIADMRIEVENLRKQSSDAQRKIADREDLIGQLKEQQKSYLDAIHLLRNRLQKADNKLSSSNTAHQKQIDSIRTKWIPFKQQLEDLRKKNAILLENKKHAEEVIQKLESQLKEVKRVISQQRNRSELYREQLQISNKKLIETKKMEQAKYNDYVQILEGQLAKSQQKADLQQEDIKQLKQNDRQKDRRISQLTSTVRQQVNLISQLQNTVIKHQSIMEKYKSQQRQHQQTIAKLAKQMQLSRHIPSQSSNKISQLQLMRADLARLRNSQIDRMDRVFNAFRLSDA